jgi:hypothetical protein
MNCTIEVIEELLRTFEHTEKQNDVEALVSRFADMFLVAGPDGARAVRMSDFALALPKRQWRMGFAHRDGQVRDVVVGSTYVVDTKHEPKILFYLTHQDITTVLREAGILAA